MLRLEFVQVDVLLKLSKSARVDVIDVILADLVNKLWIGHFPLGCVPATVFTECRHDGSHDSLNVCMRFLHLLQLRDIFLHARDLIADCLSSVFLLVLIIARLRLDGTDRDVCQLRIMGDALSFLVRGPCLGACLRWPLGREALRWGASLGPGRDVADPLAEGLGGSRLGLDGGRREARRQQVGLQLAQRACTHVVHIVVL